ncbi:glycosyltransferase family A protein [Massilia sp. PAMC28688]|uniref:glycosyltransferase family 2 protein n=1 Tax=Massilia sp. PAMC28688 TaxID=2861283 RepID=UPI001E645E50|nr:glycosyltransferase family A protein [Massilia sp. PAMC28688]
MSDVLDVLIPTCNRASALAVTLCALAAQTLRHFRIIISDQSDGPGIVAAPEVQAVTRFLRVQDIDVVALRHLPRRGMAEQRAFLLAQVTAPFCLFLDDDVIVEPSLLARMLDTIRRRRCGFVGSALHGLSYLGERRPAHEAITFWDGEVLPETIRPGTQAWERHHLHSAANLYHVQRRLELTVRDARCYRVAWVGGCVLFDTGKLRDCGGFDFWPDLPADHAGEDVLAQLRVMARFGGCGLIPSGAYHMELPTTLPVRSVDAPQLLWP